MEKTQQKSIVLLSGGLDSTTLLYHLISMGHEVKALGIDYNQRHSIELEHAEKICKAMEVPFLAIDLSFLSGVMKGSSQTDRKIEVPEGHYAADNMAVTVVPNRNMILLSIATAYAISEKAPMVAYAAHLGDHDQYPDCRQVFIDALAEAIKLCDNNPPHLIAPFSGLTKTQIAERAKILGVPVHLTYSCYKGQESHCGKCGTCVERLEALSLAGIDDKTEYLDREYWKTVTKTSATERRHARALCYGEQAEQTEEFSKGLSDANR